MSSHRFSPTLMEFFNSSARRRSIKNADRIGRSSLAGGAPSVTIFLVLNNDRIVDAAFEAAGCGVTIACAAALTEMVVGKTLEDGGKLKVEDLVGYLDGLPADKIYCASVTRNALENALNGGELSEL